jgi:hypothetical protein
MNRKTNPTNAYREADLVNLAMVKKNGFKNYRATTKTD